MATARIVDNLRSAILGGDIEPGEWIRQEEVAERFGVSRIPVREALRILESEGLTEHSPHKGARVPVLTRHEMDVIYQMRERLEPLILSESLMHLDRGCLDRLAELQREIEGNSDVSAFLELDREFHLLTYSGCSIHQLTSAVTRLWNSTQHYRRAFMSIAGHGRMWIVNAEHRLILDALERKDPVDAERYLGGHIRRTRIELNRHPEVFAR